MPTTPPNNDFANALLIGPIHSPDYFGITSLQTTVDATREDGELNIQNSLGGATANAIIECENQPSGAISIWRILLSNSGLTPAGNVTPGYDFTYTWP